MKTVILSARLEAGVYSRLDSATKKFRITKKKFLEDAIALKLAELGAEDDVWAQTSGAWHRDESPNQIRKNIRSTLDDNFTRRHRR